MQEEVVDHPGRAGSARESSAAAQRGRALPSPMRSCSSTAQSPQRGLREHQSWIDALQGRTKLMSYRSLIARRSSPRSGRPPRVPNSISSRTDASASHRRPCPAAGARPAPPASYPQRHPAHVEFQHGQARVRAIIPWRAHRRPPDRNRRRARPSRRKLSSPTSSAPRFRSADPRYRYAPDVTFVRRELPGLAPALSDLGWIGRR